MYGVAYIIIPTEFASLQAALDETLAPFRRGGADDFPREKLAFDDATEDLRRLHAMPIEVKANAGGIGSDDPALPSDLDFDAVRALLNSKGVSSWSGRLADVEPDFDAFARRFTRWNERDSEAGAYGRWMNRLGRWDWWGHFHVRRLPTLISGSYPRR